MTPASTIYVRGHPWAILISVGYHLTCGVILLLEPADVVSSAAQVTALSHLAALVPGRHSLGVLLLLIGILAAVGARERQGANVLWVSLQQLALLLSASGAVWCVVSGTFADGAVYPRGFIAADQNVYIWIALGHTCQIWDIYVGRWWRRG